MYNTSLRESVAAHCRDGLNAGPLPYFASALHSMHAQFVGTQYRLAVMQGHHNLASPSTHMLLVQLQDRATQGFVEAYFRARSSLTSPAWIGISRGTANQVYKFIDGTNVAQVRVNSLCTRSYACYRLPRRRIAPQRPLQLEQTIVINDATRLCLSCLGL
jgi:hypothetical protein